jgi:phosphoesterase RecJ-like protein
LPGQRLSVDSFILIFRINKPFLQAHMRPLKELSTLLASPKKILITHHYNPDADALGSTLGLAHYLRSQGHHAVVISPNTIPDFLMWMPGANEVLIYDQQSQAANIVIDAAEIHFSLDYNHLSRTQSMFAKLQEFTGVRVLIDHHLFPDSGFDYGNSIPTKSSTCEMVYDFIMDNGSDDAISMSIARCLYAGVMTDTGSFKFPSTTASVHAMVARLMDKGLQPSKIHQDIFDTYGENRLRFLGFVLSEKMQIFPESHAAIISVSREELSRFQLKTGDTEGIVNYPLSIQNILFSTFISERDAEIRMSFRSKGHFDVNQFARTYFQGGGHANAAGGKSHLPLDITLENYRKALSENQTQLQKCFQELS